MFPFYYLGIYLLIGCLVAYISDVFHLMSNEDFNDGDRVWFALLMIGFWAPFLIILIIFGGLFGIVKLNNKIWGHK